MHEWHSGGEVAREGEERRERERGELGRGLGGGWRGELACL